MNTHEGSIRALGYAFQPRGLAAEQVAVYLIAVEDLPADDVHAAVVALIRSGGRFLPRPGELRQAVAELHGDLPADPVEAWGQVVGELHRVGRYGTPDLEPTTRRVVDWLGGWGALCDSENQTADRARFLDAYDRLAEREARQRLVAPRLAGVIGGALPGSLFQLPGAMTRSNPASSTIHSADAPQQSEQEDG